MTDTAKEASEFFNSLPYETRKKLAPLLEDYRCMGLREATTAMRSVVRKMDERAKALDVLAAEFANGKRS